MKKSHCPFIGHQTRILNIYLLSALLILFTSAQNIQTHIQKRGQLFSHQANVQTHIKNNHQLHNLLPNQNNQNQELLTFDITHREKQIEAKANSGWIVAIICIILCFVCCFFCFKCITNPKKQSQQDIPGYCRCCSWGCKILRVICCLDCILRLFGYQRKQKAHSNQPPRLMQEERFNANGPHVNRPQEQINNLSNKWKPVSTAVTVSLNDRQKIKKAQCNICLGKTKKPCNCVLNCSNHCPFHLQCLINDKNNVKNMGSGGGSNECPNCRSNYFNIVNYFCQKCHDKYTQILLESGNVYQSNLNAMQIFQSIGGQKCPDCAKKRGFFGF